MKLYDNDEYRETFMELVYSLLHSDGTNDRANLIIDAFDAAPAVEATPESPNVPITLAELLEMDGKPICIAMLVNNEELNSQWVIYSGNNVFINYMLNDMRVYFLCQIKDYGKTWIAYRHKKENAKNEN